MSYEDIKKEDTNPGGRLLSDRYKDVPREMSPAAVWLDKWVVNPVMAIGYIADISSLRSEAESGIAINDFVFSDDPVIDIADFKKACFDWLNSGSHLAYQYQELFYVLSMRDDLRFPEVQKWYIDHLDFLKKLFLPSGSGYSRFIETLEFLSTGKTLKDHREWWIDQVRKARKERGEVE
jgi:hypothetical protein